MSIANLITRTFTGAAAAAILAFGFSAGAAAADKVIHIGVTPVPHADIVNFINLKTVESTLSQIRRRRARGTSGLWPSSP